MSGDDDGPDGTVSAEVGAVGVTLFSILFMMTLFSSICAKNKYSRRLFVSSTAMCMLELPRYIALIVEREYTDRATYILHMWASVFFFAAFTCVIYIMHDAVDLSQSHSPLAAMITSPTSCVDRIVIDKTALVVVNLAFALITLITSISCALFRHLDEFFHESTMFAVFTLCDVIKNLIVASAFMFYGCRLKQRINIFYESFGITTVASSPDELGLLDKLKKVVRRLLTVMTVCLISFLVRTAMLIFKAVSVEEDNIHLSWLPTFGLLWFVFSDFIPRCLPILSFVTFFGGRNRLHTRDNSKSLYTTGIRSTSDEGGIRRFPHDEEDEKRAALLADLDDEELNPDREYDNDNSSQGDHSGHSYHKINSAGRESVNSVESYDTTSSGHTVRYTTATDFSTSYRPPFAHEKRGQYGRKSESTNYLSGSIIVNALMWPIAHGQRNSRTNSSQPGSNSGSQERMSTDIPRVDSGEPDNNDAHTLSNTLSNTLYNKR